MKSNKNCTSKEDYKKNPETTKKQRKKIITNYN